MHQIILASGSEGRRELFQEAFGDNFQIYVSDINEDYHSKDPKEIVKTLATQKANETFKYFSDDFVFAFDTMVSCQDTILGKPANTDEARDMLQFLNNKIQTVWTGYSIRYKDIKIDDVASSELILSLTNEEIEEYISTHPVTKYAGAYAIQKIDNKIQIISGSMDIIIGAPMDIIKKFITTNLTLY